MRVFLSAALSSGAAFGLLLAVLPAQAASFDCAKAGTPVEKAICSAPDLSELDEQLAAVYKQARQDAGPEGAETIRQSQLNWLKARNVFCTEKRHEVFDDVLAGVSRDCLRMEYRERIKDLQGAITILSPWKFVREDFITLARNQAIPGESFPWPYGVLQISRPVAVEGPEIEGWNVFVWQQTTSEVDGDQDQTYETSILHASDSLITAREDWYFYGHGAAHGQYGERGIHYLPKLKQGLTGDLVFADGSGWEESLGTLTHQALVALAKQEDWPMQVPQDEIRDMAQTVNRWLIQPSGLTIIFNPYDVASFADGIKRVEIPWDDLRPYLRKDSPIAFLN